MRGVATRYATKQQPATIKKVRSKVVHVSPPALGMSFLAKSADVDAKYASVITNLYVDDDRVSIRAGYRKIAQTDDGNPVEALIPWYGLPEKLIAASGGHLYDATTGTEVSTAYTSADWHWTAFSNLGEAEYTVMVNGADGVVAWDGSFVPGGAEYTVTKITGGPGSVGPPVVPAANPAMCYVSSSDITHFHDGMTVIISGADANHAAANGSHRITQVNNPPNAFSLVGVNLTGAPGDQTTGTMKVTLQGSFEKMAITPPAGNTWLNPNQFHIVVAHQNRLWFADETNLAAYYLPIQQKDGVLAVLPMTAIFKRGGTIKAMATWTVDSGTGLDDNLVVFTTNGECAIYKGVDPGSDMILVGVYRSDPPMSKHCTINYGGDLYVLLPTGVTPMTSMIKAGREGLDSVDKSMIQYFLRHSIMARDQPGWSLFLNPSTGRLFCNLPLGGGVVHQAIRHMPKAVWSTFDNVNALCWGWINPYVYFGDSKGNIYQMHPDYTSDDGKPIKVDVLMAWNQFKTPALKHFKMILPYIVTDGNPRPYVEVKVDYDISDATNWPEISDTSEGGAEWDVALWDYPDQDPPLPVGALWVGGNRNYGNWTGVGGLGRVGAVRLTAHVSNCSFAVTGFDVLYEEGSVFG
jgi:hypothetical protein